MGIVNSGVHTVGNSKGTPLSGNCIFIKPHTLAASHHPPIDQELIRIGLNWKILHIRQNLLIQSTANKFVRHALEKRSFGASLSTWCLHLEEVGCGGWCTDAASGLDGSL